MGKIDNILEENSEKKGRWIDRQSKDKEIAYRIMKNKSLEVGENTKELQKYLDTQVTFEMYSVANCLLIQSQKSNATYCKDLKSWQMDGYIVRKRDEDIIIFESSDSLIQEDGSKKIYYNTKKVYDISSTNAPRRRDVEKYSAETVFRGLVKACPVTIKPVDTLNNENKIAMYDEKSNVICVKKGEKVENMIQDICTEASKYFLKLDENIKQETVNFKSECVSYMFCKKFGIPFQIEKLEHAKSCLNGNDKEIRDELSTIKETYLMIKTRTVVMLEKANKSKAQER